MSEINDLRERVEAAEERFGLMDEQQRHYSDRLLGLIETIEAQLAAARSEIEQQIAEIQRLGGENEELRGMLHTVLRSVEEKTFTQTLQNLEARVSALVSGAQATGTAAVAPGSESDGDRPTTDTTEAADSSAEQEDTPEIDAVIEADDAAEIPVEAEVILEASPEETPQGEPEGVAAETDPLSAEELMAQAKEAAAAALDGETAAEEDLAEMPDTESAAIAAPPAGDEPAPAEEAVGFDCGDEDAAEPDALAETGAEIIAPEEAMGDVTFEDDPEAVAESDTGGADVAEDIAAEAPPAADAAAEEMSDPETTDLEAAEPETGSDAATAAEAETSVAAAFDQLAETAAAASEADASGTEATPTVKEIIRRVGDLARELEKAESQRKAAQASADAPEAEVTAPDENAAPGVPPFDQAANG